MCVHRFIVLKPNTMTEFSLILEENLKKRSYAVFLQVNLPIKLSQTEQNWSDSLRPQTGILNLFFKFSCVEEKVLLFTR
jgi:hypothetical protein